MIFIPGIQVQLYIYKAIGMIYHINKVKDKNFMNGRADQDGRIEGHGAHLLPQIHQKHIFMWNNCHRITTKLWQKITYNQNCKKDH